MAMDVNEWKFAQLDYFDHHSSMFIQKIIVL